MKQVFLLAVAFVSLTAFSIWETIKGDGNFKQETREVGQFSGVALQGSMNVMVSYGNSNTITVDADENLLPYIETVVKDGKLVVRSKDKTNLKSKNKIVIKISMTKMDDVSVSGSGNITGSGNFSHNGTTHMKVSGSGNIDLAFASFSALNTAVSGSGNIKLKGNNVNGLDAVVSGSGNIDCLGVNANEANVKISGSGNVKVNAGKSIDAKISGSGNVYYKGAAEKANTKISGSGKLIKV